MTDCTPTIRQLTKEDLPMIEAFYDQMGGETRSFFNRNNQNRLATIRNINAPDQNGRIFFAAVEPDASGAERMVGFVFIWDIHTFIPWLGICVSEDSKGKHLGRTLLQYLDDFLIPKGYGGLMLTTALANVRAQALYERMGFQNLGQHTTGEFLYLKRYSKP